MNKDHSTNELAFKLRGKILRFEEVFGFRNCRRGRWDREVWGAWGLRLGDPRMTLWGGDMGAEMGKAQRGVTCESLGAEHCNPEEPVKQWPKV